MKKSSCHLYLHRVGGPQAKLISDHSMICWFFLVDVFPSMVWKSEFIDENFKNLSFNFEKNFASIKFFKKKILKIFTCRSDLDCWFRCECGAIFTDYYFRFLFFRCFQSTYSLFCLCIITGRSQFLDFMSPKSRFRVRAIKLHWKAEPEKACDPDEKISIHETLR